MAATIPVFLIDTRYSAAGKTYILLMQNDEDPTLLAVFQNYVIQGEEDRSFHDSDCSYQECLFLQNDLLSIPEQT